MNRIAFIATGYIQKYDGISVYAENFLQELIRSDAVRQNNLSVDIFTGMSVIDLLSQRIGYEEVLFENIHFIAVDDRGFIKKTLDMIYKIRQYGRYDLVLMPNFIPSVCLGSPTLKVIHDFSVNHFPELYPKFYPFYHDMLLRYGKFFDTAIGFSSLTTKKDLDRFHNVNDSNKHLVHLPCGIPFKVKNYPRPDKQANDEKYHSKHLEILVVGRVNRHKGFDRILAFCEYYDRVLDAHSFFESFTLHIVGKQTDETEAMLRGLHLKNIVLNFHGFMDDDGLNKLYQKSQFCFFLSRNEGYGLPLMEAMWFRCIPIISNIPIFTEITGVAYPKFDDENGYTKAISTFIDNICQDDLYRQDIWNQIEIIVSQESDGYKRTVKNLLDFIDTLPRERQS